MKKILKVLFFIGLAGLGVFIGIVALFLLWVAGLRVQSYWRGSLSRHIDVLLEQSKMQVPVSELIAGPWRKVCFVPTDYNSVTQHELDTQLGQAGLVSEASVWIESNNLYVVTYRERPEVHIYSKIELLDKASIVCTSNPKSLITLSRGRDNFAKNLSTTFEDRFMAHEFDDEIDKRKTK